LDRSDSIFGLFLVVFFVIFNDFGAFLGQFFRVFIVK
jgi:hypothetical protein